MDILDGSIIFEEFLNQQLLVTQLTTAVDNAQERKRQAASAYEAAQRAFSDLSRDLSTATSNLNEVAQRFGREAGSKSLESTVFEFEGQLYVVRYAPPRYHILPARIVPLKQPTIEPSNGNT